MFHCDNILLSLNLLQCVLGRYLKFNVNTFLSNIFFHSLFYNERGKVCMSSVFTADKNV